MKKILTLAVVLSSIFSFAQQSETKDKLVLEKGIWSLGGNLGFTTQNRNYDRDSNNNMEANTNTFNVNPKIGLLVKDNLEMGIDLNFGHSKTNIDNNTENEKSNYSNNSLGFSPYVKAYHSINHNLALFLKGEVSYSRDWSKSENENPSSNSGKGFNFFAGLTPGITYFLSKTVALDANLGRIGYQYNESKSENFSNSNQVDKLESTANTFLFTINPSDFLFGLSFYF